MSRQPPNIARRTLSPIPQLEGDLCSKATRGTTVGRKEEEEEEPRVLSPVLQLEDTSPSSWVRRVLQTPNDHSTMDL